MRNLIFCLLLLAPTNIKAQPAKLSFDHLMEENGMPEGYAIDICQDKKGYIWCGTQRGLIRYDGYSVKVYRHEELNNNTSINVIGSVFVNKNGIVWAGTIGNNLLRYNAGADSFSIFKPDSMTKGAFYYITYMAEDGQNNLWLMISNPENPLYQLERFEEKTGKFFMVKVSSHENADILSNHITGLLTDKEGQTWIGTENGIYTYNYAEKKFKGYLVSPDTLEKRVLFNLYEPPSEPSMLYMSVVSLTPQGILPKGFVRFDVKSHKAIFYHHNEADTNSLSNDETTSFYEDSKKRLWIGANNNLIYFDRAKETCQTFGCGGDALSFDFIKEDMDGKLWITGASDSRPGLLYFDPGKKIFQRYYGEPDRADGLASNYIEQIFADRTGGIWLAFNGFGIERMNRVRSRFTSFMYNPKDSIGYPGGVTNSFAQTKDGTYWLATSEGLTKYDPQKGFTKTKLFNDPAKNNLGVSRILLDNEGFLWFRYAGNGLIRYNPETGLVKSFRHNDKDSTSLSSDFISCLLQDHNGVIWIGTDGSGLCRYNKDKENFTRYPYINNSKVKYNGTALDDGGVISIHEDRQERLWISTNLGGLNLMDRNKGIFKSYFDETAGISNIGGIEDADSGRLWLSTYYLGLKLFDPDKGTVVKSFTEKNGLLSDHLIFLKNDKDGNLWIGSGRGLSRFNQKTFAITNYTSLQGLPSNVLYRPFVDDKGELFIGCKFGFFNFFPRDMKPNLITPVINLESISFADEDSYDKTDTLLLNNRSKIELKHNQNRITFHYTGIQFENSLLNTYQYKLEGYDKTWIKAGGSRDATYTNLSPGTYTFYVKAANMDGVWNETPASLLITIYPPWWRTWWAYALYVLIFIAALWAFIAYRSHTLKKQNRVLENKVTDRTQQLNKSLEELKSAQAQLILQEKMVSLGELTAGIAHEIQNPLNFVNNFSEMNNELIEELKAERVKPKHERDDKLEDEILNDIGDNEQKINHHGKRADAIVKGMLLHSRSSTGKKEPTDINALCEEYLRLSYHGLRAKDKSFNADFKTDFDKNLSADEAGIGKINIVPQDIGRVLLNLFNNSFYAVDKKQKSAGETYKPLVLVQTKKINNKMEISVKDNGNGIPRAIIDKIFQPFFTTKPTGQGTGLGLSLSYDIIKTHGGEIKVESKEGEGAEFIVTLPA
jgi:signal transduction histidine kinase/ligand-binding sensor domain-containing protein